VNSVVRLAASRATFTTGVSAGAEAPSHGFSTTVHRQGACWQSQRSSVLSPACLQCSLQYFPYGPLGSTMH
jgi:hypothetical protein